MATVVTVQPLLTVVNVGRSMCDVGGRAACGTQARGAAARSNVPDSEARATRSTTTDSTSDPRAVPITIANISALSARIAARRVIT